MSFLKKYNIYLFICFSLPVLAQEPDYDQLFSQREYEKAQMGYLKKIEQGEENPALFLKLAYMAEQKGENMMLAYYLLKYDQMKANEKIVNYLSELGKKNAWLGYEKSSLNYFLLYYRIFLPYITAFLFLIGLYVLSVLLYKKIKKQFIPFRHKAVTVFYLILLFIFVNISNNYRSVIVRNDDTLLRTAASNAATVLGQVSKGNRLNWVNSEDIWLQVLWNNQLVYVKESDVMKIE